ncbi:MAG TPA: uracil-DNA glycosylase [Mobilitalea sp.]|nr:uracil-DNA glycosylase [Mobilitalea sp.]
MLLPQDISSSWKEFLSKDILDKLHDIEIRIGYDYTPVIDKIMRFLSVDLDKASVCIIGQDVYYQPGVATGRAFEVNDLYSWNSKFRQVSLKNILRLIHKSYRGITDYEEIKKYSDILNEIENGSFPILTPDKWFDSLEEQGVIFLNSSLTCMINKPNSHKDVWKDFSIQLINYMSLKRPDLIWFLWGNEAISKRQYIPNGIFFESRHPMLCSRTYDNDFLKSSCFKETMNIINWLG